MERAERLLLCLLLSCAVLLAFLQVLLRGFFGGGLLWADTLLRHLVLWMGFLGAGLAAATGRQFAVDASAHLLSGRPRALAGLAAHGFTAFVCLRLCQASLSFLREELAHAGALFTVAGRAVPAWAFELILPLGFALLCFHYLVRTLESALSLQKAGRGAPEAA